MRFLSFVAFNVLETLLRFFPFPCRTGLKKIGNPGQNAPVFLTGNYHLTVLRVKRALKGMNAYLLVTNSRGINIWCASAGGHLTNHTVISVLKTSGIEDLVEHRNVVLPQLAAPGVETEIILQRTGWRIIWGPVYAKDIPLFLENDFKKNKEWREVAFPFRQRMEIAVAWAFLVSLLLSLIILPFWPNSIFPLTLLVWSLSLIIFISFPSSERWMNSKKDKKGSLKSVFLAGRFQLLLWIGIILHLVVYKLIVQDFSLNFIFRWGILSLVAVVILSIDVAGCTPIFKSGLHEERKFKVALDSEKCRGAGFCIDVCPRNCFEMDKTNHVVTIVQETRCVQCCACIVQCPFDALHFESPDGRKIDPGTLRKFKLNLFGGRLSKANEVE